MNECYLFHGTKPALVHKITNAGFNERLCNTGGLLGAGNYFADSAHKSDAYAEEDAHGRCRIFLARVCLAHPLRLAAGARRVNTRELGEVPGARPGRRYDSLLGTPAGDNEYVVYNGQRAFPEFLLTYRRAT